MKRILSLLFISLTFLTANSQEASSKEDSLQLRKIYDYALLEGKSYDWLDHLSNKIGGRLSGSLNAQKAVDYTKAELEKLGLDKVWLQPVMVPKWTRGTREFSYLQTAPGETRDLNITALGGSISTPEGGTKAQVIEVQGLEELAELGREKIAGKIVFYNRPMRPELIHTFEADGGCVDQRYSGAEEAAKYGAVGVIVRSLSLKQDDYPHTGSMSYGNTPVSKRIPTAAISTNDADYVSGMLKISPDL